MTTEKLLFCLLRNEIKGEELPNEFALTDAEIVSLYRLSQRHDLAHLIGDALFRNNLLSKNKVADAFRQQISIAVLRYEQQNAALEQIRSIFNEGQITFVPLKGSVIKSFYPEPWMRTSCDIDILIREDDVAKATKVLVEKGFETDGKKGRRHISFFYGNFHLELHFNLCEENAKINEILKNVWDNVERISEYEFSEKEEFYAFYHIVHMARHFLSGGCGIRPFIDLWLLKQKEYYQEAKLSLLLEKCGLVKFYQALCRLIDVWFNNAEHNELTLRMEKYILEGGVYGSATNANRIGTVRSKGKIRYLFKIAFLPYNSMCIIYPVLKKHKILLPFCYIHRIFVKLFGKDRKRAKSRINNTISQSDSTISEVSGLLNELNLK